MTAPTPGHARACELLYPGLFPDEAYRRHPQQIDRVAAALDATYAEGVHRGCDDALTMVEQMIASGDPDGVIAALREEAS